MTFSPSGARKLALDEESFQQLLAAAYTLQENRDQFRSGVSDHESAAVLAEIAALRSEILALADPANPKFKAKSTKPKSAAEAAAEVARCLQRLTKADGASVCLIVDGYLRPTACAGTAAQVSGGSVASNSLVATERLRNGRGFQSANACSDIRLGPSVCVKLQIGSLLAFPIERQNEVAGIVEARWKNPDAFSGGDERICQLLADLMGEVLTGEGSSTYDQVIRPVQPSSPKAIAVETTMPVVKSDTLDPELSLNEEAPSSEPICRVCGKALSDDANFCGGCGMLSASSDQGMQGKWASMWFMQQAKKVVESSGPSERLWPIEGVNSGASATSSAPDYTHEEAESLNGDSAGEVSPASRRGPRGVLSVLKAQLRARSGERKLPRS